MLDALNAEVAAQKDRIPEIYGNVDFSITPERFTADPLADSAIRQSMRHLRTALLADEERVALIKAYAMMGDRVADAYAALLPQFGFRRLVDMLDTACDKGVAAVEGAPPELDAFLEDMEGVPAWIDMDLVREGARAERNLMAHLSPFVIRGAFVATFMNKYSALPMALTGALSNSTAARRIFETATFFTVTVMPDALERSGEGFKAAAKVRLMHSMVRFNVMRRPRAWDVDTFGIPIPQVDQMPAGLIGAFLKAFAVIGRGRTDFTRRDRAIVELARYRCFLLGLPRELLGETPQEIVDLMLTRHATLRRGFDDATCGALVNATMSAPLFTDAGLTGRIRSRMERGMSKLFFVRNFLEGDFAAGARMGVTVTTSDRAWAAFTLVAITSRVAAFELLRRIPGMRHTVDAMLVRKIRRLLNDYGHADFTTDAAAYRSPLPA